MKKNTQSTKDADLKLYRIHQIDEAIRSGSFPNRVTLSKKLEVSERTIARDLDYLRDFYNAPIEFDTTYNGFYYTKKDFFVKYVTLSEGELFSISLFDQLLFIKQAGKPAAFNFQKNHKIKILCKGYLRQIATEQKWHENQTTKILPNGDVDAQVA